MSGIAPIGSGGVSRSSGINNSGSSRGSGVSEVKIKEQFAFPREFELPDRDTSALAAEQRPYFKVLVKLFVEILYYNQVDIYPTTIKDYGNYVVEGAYSPAKSKHSNPRIQVPLRGVDVPFLATNVNISENAIIHQVSEYVKCIVEASNDSDILKLMIVLSHELGHHTSFLRGFHDPELQLGLTLMQGKQYGEQACKYTWLVFREESTAWYHARQILGRSGFKDFDQFELVKNQSLKTYLSVLKLELASLDIYYKLSLLGDDFFNNCTSELFQKFT